MVESIAGISELGQKAIARQLIFNLLVEDRLPEALEIITGAFSDAADHSSRHDNYDEWSRLMRYVRFKRSRILP